MSEIGLMAPPPMSEPHDRTPVAGSRVGDHGICQCGRIVELSPSPGSRLGRENRPYWRHHPNPTSTMIPAAVREAHRG